MEKNKDKAGMTENPELAAEFAAMRAALEETPAETEGAATEEMPHLKLERERFKGRDSGTAYWGYFVRGHMFGEEVRATLKLSADDSRGYKLLDLFYTAKGGADLFAIPYARKDEATGRIMRGHSYEVQTTDEDGELLTVRIYPSKASDKSVLDYLFRKAARQLYFFSSSFILA